jgi:tetratricopeptide (TPR) repeat protein
MDTMARLSRVLIALVALTIAACSGAASRKQEFIAQGQKHMAERNWQKARVEFRNVLQVDPKDSRAVFLLGVASERLGDYSAAAGAYKQALDIDKTRLDARQALARLYARGGAPKDAVALVEEGLLQQPDDAALLAIRGIAKDQLGDASGALADGEAAARIASGDATAGMLLGVLYQRSGRTADALAVVERATRASPDDLELNLLLADLYRSAGQGGKSAAQLQRAIDLEPKRLDLRLRLANSYVLDKNIDAAEKALRDAVAARPEDVDAKVSLATLIATQRSFEAGEKSLKDLALGDAGNERLRMALGRFYESNGRKEAATQVYQDIVNRDPEGQDGVAARDRLALMRWAAGNADAALALVEQVLALNSHDNTALALRASVAMSRGDPAAAIADLRAVLRDQPNAPAVMQALADAYVAAKEPVLAEETLRASMQANPTDARTRMALSQFLLKADRRGEAQAVVDELSSSVPADLEALEASLRVQVARRDFAAARGTADRLGTLRPDLPTGHFLKGLVDEAEGKRQDALAQFDKALSLAPDAIEPLTAAVRTEIALQRPDRAMQRVEAVLRQAPNNAAVVNLKGELLMQLKQYDAAISTLSAAIALKRDWWVAYRNLGQSELAAGRREKAIDVYQRGMQATGNAPILLMDLATLQEAAGRPEEAIRLYEDWVGRSGGSQMARNNLAMLLVTHRSTDKRSLDRALELALPLKNATQAAYVDTYGWVRHTRGEYMEAVEALTRALTLVPGTPVVQAHLGLAQFKAGQREEAKKNLQLAVSSGQTFPGLADARAALQQL